MRNTNARFSRAYVSLAVAAALLSPASIPAQTGPPGPGANFGGHRWGGDFGGFRHSGLGKVVTGEPYTATAVTSTTLTLADGTHITRQNTATIARDSEGRVMHSETITSGSQSGATVVSIFDPVANQRIVYNTATKVAHIFILPAKTAGTNTASDSIPAPGAGRFHPNSMSVASESLGTQTFAGVTAQGTKVTRTVAAGAVGNDQPLVSTEEKWYSSDLQIVLQSTRSDPRNGQTTYTVSNLQRNEPNASLFQVPAGYQSKTVNLPSHSTVE